MAVTVADVERLDANGWKSLSSDRKQALLDDAQREYDTIYDSRNSRFPTLEGDKDVFIKNLTAHKWELAEGGEASSEGGQGGSTSYVTGMRDLNIHSFWLPRTPGTCGDPASPPGRYPAGSSKAGSMDMPRSTPSSSSLARTRSFRPYSR